MRGGPRSSSCWLRHSSASNIDYFLQIGSELPAVFHQKLIQFTVHTCLLNGRVWGRSQRHLLRVIRVLGSVPESNYRTIRGMSGSTLRQYCWILLENTSLVRSVHERQWFKYCWNLSVSVFLLLGQLFLLGFWFIELL